MTAIIFNFNALRKAYKNIIITLPDIFLYRKTVDESMAAEPCYFYIKS